jgi:hypothetical protein
MPSPGLRRQTRALAGSLPPADLSGIKSRPKVQANPAGRTPVRSGPYPPRAGAVTLAALGGSSWQEEDRGRE